MIRISFPRQLSLFKKLHNVIFQKRSKHHGHGLSYLSNPGRGPLSGLTIGALLDKTAAEHGDREGIVAKHQNIRKTFAEIKLDSDDLAEGLLAAGLEKGDRIGIWGSNSYEWYLTQMAVAKAGFILVNINPAYEGTELLYALNKVSMRGLVIAEEFRGRNYYDILSSVIPSVSQSDPGRIKAPEAPALSTIISMSSKQHKGTFPFEEILLNGGRRGERKQLSKISPTVQFGDVFNIQFTSGTTGKPKGVMLTHHNMVNNSAMVATRINMSHRDKLCLPVPFFHCYGQVVGLLAGLHAGCLSVIPSPGFDAKQALVAVEEEKCSILYGTPTMHVDMINVNDGKDLSSLRAVLTAGAICPEDLAVQMRSTYGCKVVMTYGLTETSPVILQSLPDDSDDLRNTTVGYPSEHTEVKVVDEQGCVVPLGVAGELCTRGYMTMKGYWDDPVKTAEVLKDGWFHTGDMFSLDEKGYARVVGRLKDMIIRGGENIYPREVEEFLHLHPKIIEAHVFGLPDHRLGEVVAAWIRLKDGETMTEDELRSYYKGKVSAFKIPKYISFRSDFPKTTSGKIQKFRMREETMKALGLVDPK